MAHHTAHHTAHLAACQWPVGGLGGRGLVAAVPGLGQALAAGAALAALAVLAHWVRSARARGWLALGLLGVAAVAAMPGPWRDALQTGVAQWWPLWRGSAGANAVHAVVFAVLGAGVVATRRQAPGWGLAGQLALVALAAEAVQLWVPGRQAMWPDAAINLGSVALGAALGWAGRWAGRPA